MLEKIVNINPGSDYKQSSRSDKSTLASRYLTNYHHSNNDSVSLSPATAFLTGIHWQLKNFHYEKEKLYLTFSFDGFEFTTTLTTGDISVINYLDYSVKHLIEIFTGPAELELNISSPIKYKSTDKIELKLELPALKDFYDTIAVTNKYNLSLIDANDYQIQNIFINRERELNKEFDYINKCLINFLEKYLSVKVMINSNPKVLEQHLILKKLLLRKD